MKISIRRPDDMHVHLRDGAALKAVARHTALRFARALVMPNTTPPVKDAADVARYRRQVTEAAPGLDPLMTIKLLPSTTPDGVREARAAGAVAGKVYPSGVTTNSDDGVKSVRDLYPVFEAMQECGMILCLHGEAPDAFCMDRESAFLPDLRDVAATFPRLRTVLEHVTTEDAVRTVLSLPDTVAATVTVHHLFLILDDVVGDKLAPHNFCKPLAKRPEDRRALLDVVFAGVPKFFLGTDSAPHLRASKECAHGCAGCYTAPVALEALVQAYDDCCVNPELMEGFTSRFGAAFYGLPPNEGVVTLRDEPWTVPDEIDGFVPFMAGQVLEWRLDV